MSDLEALYRAVLARPEEDTPRLMYADEIEDTDPARAELIRAQCARADLLIASHGITYRECPVMGGCVSVHCADCERALDLELRTAQLLTANRERWEPACVACGGEGWHDIEAGYFGREKCRTCKGSGRQPCRWERGFPVVEVAEMRQAWQHISDYRTPPALSWEPTPWLLDAIRAHHIAGVAFTGPFLITSETVPWAVMKRLKGNTLGGESWVLVALEWADAREVVA